MSIESEAVKLLLRSSNVKWNFSSDFAMRHFVKNRRPILERNPRDYFGPEYDISRQVVDGFVVYQVCPAHEKPRRHILFLHGGAYVSVMKGVHWGFLRRLMRETPCQVTVPLYGLAPRYHYKDAYPLLDKVYQSLLQQHDPNDIVFMGDSCGGGLSLGFAQTLAGRNLPQPGGLVLLSPWLDITLQNPAIRNIEPHDPVLAVPGNQEAGRMWAAGDNLCSPMLSPLYGELIGLAPILAMIGSCDILMPDVRVLYEKAQAQNHPFEYREYPGMFHIWMLSPIPEGRQAVREIAEFIRWD
jgi:Esterase/lipase